MSVSLSEIAVQGRSDSSPEAPKAPEQDELSPQDKLTRLVIERSQQDFSDMIDSSVAEGYQYVPVEKVERIIRDLAGYTEAGDRGSIQTALESIVNALEEGEAAVRSNEKAKEALSAAEGTIDDLKEKNEELHTELNTLGKEFEGTVLSTEDEALIQEAVSEALAKIKLIPGQREVVEKLQAALTLMDENEVKSYRRTYDEWETRDEGDEINTEEQQK